jgi:starvation-inducible outer membrane lipoprotein
MKIIFLFLLCLSLTACACFPQATGKHVLVVESMREQKKPRHAPQTRSVDDYCSQGHHDNNWC